MNTNTDANTFSTLDKHSNTNTGCFSPPAQQSVTDVRAVIESQFEQLQALVERAKREVTEILEAEEKQALRQAEGIRVHLEQRCAELKKTQAQMDKLSRNKNDVDFLQVTGKNQRRLGLFTRVFNTQLQKKMKRPLEKDEFLWLLIE